MKSIKKTQHRSSNPYKRSKPTKCTKCGKSTIIDITESEFPGKKNLVFECVSCGNNSLRSNVSEEERRNRLRKVADEHLDIVECQFCHRRLSSTNEYLTHLRNDHPPTPKI